MSKFIFIVLLFLCSIILIESALGMQEASVSNGQSGYMIFIENTSGFRLWEVFFATDVEEVSESWVLTNAIPASATLACDPPELWGETYSASMYVDNTIWGTRPPKTNKYAFANITIPKKSNLRILIGKATLSKPYVNKIGLSRCFLMPLDQDFIFLVLDCTHWK